MLTLFISAMHEFSFILADTDTKMLGKTSALAMRIAKIWSELVKCCRRFRKRNRVTFPRCGITHQHFTFLTNGFVFPRTKCRHEMPKFGPNACNLRAGSLAILLFRPCVPIDLFWLTLAHTWTLLTERESSNILRALKYISGIPGF